MSCWEGNCCITARGSNIVGLVLKSGLKTVGVGVAVGLTAALELTYFLASLLYGVKPLDPVTFLATPVFLSLVGRVSLTGTARRQRRSRHSSIPRIERRRTRLAGLKPRTG